MIRMVMEGSKEDYVMGRAMQTDVSVNVQSLQNLLPTTPTGMEDLDSTDNLYIFKHSDPIHFPTEFPSLSHYVIVNDSCRVIYIVAELNSRGTDKAFIMHMFSPGGKIILKFLQRHKELWRLDAVNPMGDLKPLLARDQQLPTIVQDGGSYVNSTDTVTEPAYDIVDDKPDAHTHLALPTGEFLGTLWRSESAWVVHDKHLYPLYTLPVDPDPRYPTPQRLTSDVIYGFYSAGAEINSYIGRPFGRIETQVELSRCGQEMEHWLCVGVRFPDHFYVRDKVLILGVALNQYCRQVPVLEDGEVEQRKVNNRNATSKCLTISCNLLIFTLAVLFVIIVAGLLFNFSQQV